MSYWNSAQANAYSNVLQTTCGFPPIRIQGTLSRNEFGTFRCEVPVVWKIETFCMACQLFFGLSGMNAKITFAHFLYKKVSHRNNGVKNAGNIVGCSLVTLSLQSMNDTIVAT